MTLWLSSDHHFGHTNVIKYCSRPYAHVDEMNKDLMDKWNAVVARDDDVYYLGDFCMHWSYYEILRRLNGRNIFFVLGNHDNEKKLRKLCSEDSWLGSRIHIRESEVIGIGSHNFKLVHRPIFASETYNTLCGHVHERWLLQKPGYRYKEHKRGEEGRETVFQKPVLNVGVDVHGYFPINEYRVLELLKECL